MQGTLSDNGQDMRFEQVDDGPAEVARLLEQVRHNVTHLLADVPSAPRRLRVQVAEIVVEIEWGGPAEPGEPVAAPETPVAPLATDTGEYLTSPTVGVFYRSPEPGAAPFVTEGDTVRAGQRVGLVEVMKLMIPVEADRAGTVTKVLKDNGEPVEYGEPLVVLAV
jgi:acetyl-CoA carboxylase biotin carboxyl carrier protein